MKTKFKTALRTAAAVAAIAVASSASATAYRWTITDNNPDGGDADIVGTFDFDTVTGSYSNWDLTTNTENTAVTDERFGGHYLPGNSTLGSGQDLHLALGQRYTFEGPRPQYELNLFFSAPLEGGGTVHGDLFERKWMRDGTVHQTGDFTMTAMPVPEPETLAMSLAGLAAVGGSLLRRRRAAAKPVR